MKLNKIKEEKHLIENKDKALISKQLVTLKHDVPK
jgi:5'-3' exonuclease